jgi:glyoxylase-like metal-dependent hydrolase (beta-lactamase superfamily II)
MKTTQPFLRLLISSLLLSWLPQSQAAVGDIGSYISPERTFSTASYWIEGTDGVVLIDTQFLPKEGLLAVQAAERATGKKVSTAIVLHPNPDKFNGTQVMQAQGIRVITAKQVAELISKVHAIRWGWFGQEYSPDYPREAGKPDVFGDQTQFLTLAGLPLTLHVLGRGASGAHVVVQFKDNVFVGDLINPSNHAWLELGYVTEWLSRLAEIAKLSPKLVYPGRGKIGGPALIENQAAYLTQVRAWVRELSNDTSLGWFKKQLLIRKIQAAYPDLALPIFMRDGIEAVWFNEKTKQ